MNVNKISPSPIPLDSSTDKQGKTEDARQKKILSTLFERRKASTPSVISQRIGSRRESKIANDRPAEVNLRGSNFDANAVFFNATPVSPIKETGILNNELGERDILVKTASESLADAKEEVSSSSESDKALKDMKALLNNVKSLDPDEIDKEPNIPSRQTAFSPNGPESSRLKRHNNLIELPLMWNAAWSELPPIIAHEVRRHKYASDSLRSQNVPDFKKKVSAKLSPVRNKIPKGINLDGHGNLKGTYSLTKTPTYQGDGVDEFPGKNDLYYESYFNQALNEEIKRATKFVGPELEERQQVLVTDQAFLDLHRGEVEFVHEGTIFRSQEHKIKGENLHKEAVALAFIDLATFPAARTVISSVLTQGFATAFWKGLISVDGRPMSHLRMITSRNTVGRQVELVQPDGTRQIIGPHEGMGSAKLKILRDGNDFRLLFDWQAYAEAKPNARSLLPLAENEVIGIRFQAEFMISGEAATQGRMEMSTVGGLEGIQVTFSGRLDLN